MLGIRHTQKQIEVKNGNDVIIYIGECIEVIYAYICKFTGTLIVELHKIEMFDIINAWDIIA